MQVKKYSRIVQIMYKCTIFESGSGSVITLPICGSELVEKLYTRCTTHPLNFIVIF